MFLKRITICGFKSFSDKVDFDFGPGVTCIVGPNGCGKSNLVDAFKWVLGEQSARSLRGRQMSDMIFNGSSIRRSSGMAQVDLVFDNSDHALPLDAQEVTATRKLYRSGESEYLLNHESARLKDVRELFLDTGVGVDAYSVVEQGRVDGLLQSNPVERRIIFEEAAGISKYKARRREAQRKLERTQQNLLRVSDVIEELEKRLRSVKLQAGKARNYREYEARLNELRSSFAMAEYHRFTEELDRLTREVQQRGDRVTALRTEIGQQETEESHVKTHLDELAEQINRADSDFIQGKSELLAQQERIESGGGRVEEQKALLERAKERHTVDTRRYEESQQELTRARQSVSDLQQQTSTLHGRIDELIEQDRSLARDLAQAQSELEDEKAGIIELLRKSAQMHNEVVRLNTHRESLVDQKGRLSQRTTHLLSELEKALEQQATIRGRLRQLDAIIRQQEQTLEEKKAQAMRVGAVRQKLVDELARTKEGRSALASRRELLEDLEKRMEGVGTAARRLLDRKNQPDAPVALDALAGLVADVFEIDVAHAPIIEAALGESAQHLVMTDGRVFLEHAATFDDLPGRLSAVCLDRLGPMVNERDYSDQPGFVARAVDLVRYAEPFEHLARHLLAKTIVVETLDAAYAMSALDVAGHRFVTRKGEVVEPDGRISLGPASSQGGLISRKSELRELEHKQTEINERLKTLGDQLNRTQAETDHLETLQQELRTAAYEAGTAKVEANASLQTTTETVERLSNEQPIIAQEVAMLEQQISEVLRKRNEGAERLEAVERESQQRQGRVETRQQRIDDIVAARMEVQENLTQTKVRAGQLSEKRTAAAEMINALSQSIVELESAVAEASSDMEQCRGRILDAQNAMEQARQQVSTLTEQIQERENRCGALRREREEDRRRSESVTQAVKDLRGRLEEAEAGVHELDMTMAEVSVHRDELVTRVREELHVDLVTRYAQYEHTDQDWRQVEEEIAELRRKMERLGHVNLDAITELDELQERHAFLTGQRDDLNDSHGQLTRLIEKLNDEAQERFKSVFRQIRDNFRSLFRKLFGGGRADIVLEDPDDILECGIEILAQPPGKELQAISLMSGGEKSLTAIALLMSIFRSRPAPFAILDEVDAALDEANNDRFNRIIQEFVTQAQFLVITHSKWTMNIADRLYGITMQEPGVSTRVSVKLAGTHVA